MPGGKCKFHVRSGGKTGRKKLKAEKSLTKEMTERQPGAADTPRRIEVLLNSLPFPDQEMIARLRQWEASRQGLGFSPVFSRNRGRISFRCRPIRRKWNFDPFSPNPVRELRYIRH